MLYKKNNTPKLDMNLFKNPTSEYRGTPFWAWNCKLNKDILTRQIEYLKEMGFGGFHMHSRAGMATEYLSDEFMELIKTCCDKAEAEEMLAWLYDEDRWPSGAAGGIVTKDKRYRQRMLVWSQTPTEFVDKATGYNEGKPYLVGAFDVELNEDGTLKSYKMIEESASAKGSKWYAYVKTAEESGWYNNQTYIDTLSDEAVQEFIRVTYESYKEKIGDKFGKTVPAMFTDEPQFSFKKCLSFAHSNETLEITWTTDFDETYFKKYGEDITKKLPEIFWDLPDGEISVARYRYHDHVGDRFTDSFAKQCGKWCNEHGIALTGHMLFEENLKAQTTGVGEVMRAYPYFGIPGIDLLCDSIEITSAKQTQSVVHQYGKEAMLSELYGVTNWDFDFRGHKFQGDWQAALGVTVRVPHLSWVSMKGSAKRDYPASINYQAPWYKEYSYVEDHYARLNTVLTRGKPIVNVGVIHPIESYWLHFGPQDTGSDEKKALDEQFANMAKWLISGMVDFDYISEALLPEQCGEIGKELAVGCMNYKTIVVAGCETLRRTTLNILEKFADRGGRVVFVGACPQYVDAVKSDDVKALYERTEKASFEKLEVLKALSEEKTADIRFTNGEKAYNFVHAMREDNGVKWLFIAHIERSYDKGHIDRAIPENLIIALNGEYKPVLYNTVTGETESIDYETKNGKTYIYKTVYDFDSLLLQLNEGEGSYFENTADTKVVKTADFKNNVAYEREEDNVYMLDMAQYKLDNGEYNDIDEIIRIDVKVRELLDYPMADGCCAQPWVLGEDSIEHYVTLKFDVMSETEVKNVYIAAEEAEEITFNGEALKLEACGYFVDESIKKYSAGKLNEGLNTIIIKAPIGKRTSIENFFLIGDFDVYVRGCEKTITKPSRTIGFSDLTRQGLPFYGGNVKYRAEIEVPECDAVRVKVNRYRGAAIKVKLDSKEQQMIVYPPYIAEFTNISPGKHVIEFEYFGNRINTFGALHNASDNNNGERSWKGPNMWYVKDNEWSYDYVVEETGIVSSPQIEFIVKK